CLMTLTREEVPRVLILIPLLPALFQVGSPLLLIKARTRRRCIASRQPPTRRLIVWRQRSILAPLVTWRNWAFMIGLRMEVLSTPAQPLIISASGLEQPAP